MEKTTRDTLVELGQTRLLEGVDRRSREARQRLEADLRATDLSVVSDFRRLLDSAGVDDSDILPAPYIPLSGRNPDATDIGRKAIEAGKTALLTVAGGQGSRLGFEGPKGMFAVTPIRRASLFQVYAEKILGFERASGVALPWYIMTSPLNHERTREYFDENGWFGLAESRVEFFQQGTLPTLDTDGQLLLDETGGLFKNPDGHGGLVTALRKRGLLDQMQERGAEYLFYFQIDNPLVTVPDPEYLGHHIVADAQVAAKVIAKRSPDEKLGVIATRAGKPCIVEYSDLGKTNMQATDTAGRLLFGQGSIAIHIFNVSFLSRADVQLPLHAARKTVRAMDPTTGVVEERASIKFERFIFDVIPRSRALFFETDRAQEFSPVKNSKGEDSPATCTRDQIRKAAGMLEDCGVEVPKDAAGEPRFLLEISPAYAWDTATLKARLKDVDIRIDGDLLLDEDA